MYRDGSNLLEGYRFISSPIGGRIPAKKKKAVLVHSYIPRHAALMFTHIRHAQRGCMSGILVRLKDIGGERTGGERTGGSFETRCDV